MAGILSITRLSCKTAEVREEVVAALRPIVESAEQESGVQQLLVTTPLDDASTDIYIIEEFTSPATHASYHAAQPTKDFETLLKDKSLLTESPETHKCPITIKTTSGPPLPLTSQPAILLVGMQYTPNTTERAVPGWNDMATSAVDTIPGVNVFTVAEHREADYIRTVEVLDSWGSLGVLVASDAAKRNIEHNGAIRTGVKTATRLRAVAGFVGR